MEIKTKPINTPPASKLNVSPTADTPRMDITIEEKVKAKFGNFKKSVPKSEKLEEDAVKISAESIKKNKVDKNKKTEATENTENTEDEVTGKVDIHPKSPLIGDFSNNPSSDVTREKLKGLVVSGAFTFNEKERETLKNILK